MSFNKRYLGALILSPFIIFLFLGGIYLKIIALILSLFGMYEFYNVISKKGFKPVAILGYVAIIVYFLLNNNTDYLVYVLGGLTFLSLTIPVVNLKYNFSDVSVTILGFVYVGVFFSFIPLINSMEYGKYLVWLVFIASWLCDTTAYYVGRMFGKTKLCPEVSPKKTVEGSIGGLLGSAISCFVFGYFISSYGVNISLIHYIIIGLICGVFCQFGDLVASSIKRYAGVKDYSNLIPGHGGILDRFDSILFSSVVVFFYLRLILGM